MRNLSDQKKGSLLAFIGVLFITHGLINWMPELLRSSGMQIGEASLWASIPVAIAIVGALIIPRLASREHRYRILLVLFLCVIGASVLLRLQLGPLLVAGLVLDGIARSSMTTVLILTLVETKGVGEERAGSAAGAPPPPRARHPRRVSSPSIQRS